MSWPYLEDDFMEIGHTGWRSFGENLYKNIYTGEIINESGVECDEDGKAISEDVDGE